MYAHERRLVEQLEGRGADAIVVALDHAPLVGAARAHQVGRLEHRQRLQLGRLRGPLRHRQRDRRAGDGDDLEQPPRRRRQAAQPRAQHLVERDAPIAGAEQRVARVARQLVDEERVAAALRRDLLRQRRQLARAIDEQVRQPLRFGTLERADVDLGSVERAADGAVQLAQKQAGAGDPRCGGRR